MRHLVAARTQSPGECAWCSAPLLAAALQDLNAQPLLREQLDASYDAVLCVNGAQYLTQLETVMAEVGWCDGGCRPDGVVHCM
jgi:hypothetical protein